MRTNPFDASRSSSAWVARRRRRTDASRQRSVRCGCSTRARRRSRSQKVRPPRSRATPAYDRPWIPIHIRSTHPSRPSSRSQDGNITRTHPSTGDELRERETTTSCPAGGTVAGFLEEVVPLLVRHLRVVEPEGLHLRRARHVGGLDPFGEIDLLVPSEVAAGDLGQPVEEGLGERLCGVHRPSVVDEPQDRFEVGGAELRHDPSKIRAKANGLNRPSTRPSGIAPPTRPGLRTPSMTSSRSIRTHPGPPRLAP